MKKTDHLKLASSEFPKAAKAIKVLFILQIVLVTSGLMFDDGTAKLNPKLFLIAIAGLFSYWLLAVYCFTFLRRKKLHNLSSVLASVSLLALGLYAVLFFSTINSGYVIYDGQGMSPTIKSGQKVAVQPYANGHGPKRGNVVEYTSTNSLVKKYAPSGNLIHRVIGLPGDKVVISNNTVTVYNSQNPQGFNPDRAYISSSVMTYPDMTATVPLGSYFMLGDNRPNSLDSRVLGAIALKDIKGKVIL